MCLLPIILNPSLSETHLKSVTFKNLSFSYGSYKVLDNISFTASPDHSIGIVGPPGAGKTTLSRLLPRFYNPESGKIELNGKDISTLDLYSTSCTFSVLGCTTN